MNSVFTTEKNYHTLNHYLRTRFFGKVFKVSLNAGFTCPNKDGLLSTEGCTFCSKSGSGDFAGPIEKSLTDQFSHVKTLLHHKWESAKYIAYFQANTNTYAPLPVLSACYEEVLGIDPNIVVLSIATRPDCLPQEVVDYLGRLNKSIEVWVELGFQTMHPITSKRINRGYDNSTFTDAVFRLRQQGISVIVHIIDGLPGESKEMMISTARFINQHDIQGVKIHLLHVMKDTALGESFLNNPFSILSLEEYVDIVTEQLRVLRKEIVIHRLTGDAPKDLLIEPLWSLKKFVVLNEIDKRMRKNHWFQGDLHVPNH